MNGLELKEIRNQTGFTQKGLAEKLGVHWRTVQNWEKTGDISLDDYTRICALLTQKDKTMEHRSADTIVNIGSNVGSTVNSHNTTGTSGKVHELEVRMAALKAENESLKIRIEEKDNLIKMLIGTKQN